MSVFRTIAGIAQLGERQTEDLKVTGSIPVGGKRSLESGSLFGPGFDSQILHTHARTAGCNRRAILV